MPEPDRRAELREVLLWALAPHAELHAGADAALDAVMPHIEAAYQRGLMAGRSQAGYTTRRKKKEDPCATAGAGAAGLTPASTTEGDEP